MGRGVTQGSALSQVFFNAYKDTLVEKVHLANLGISVEVIMFADDVACFASDNVAAQQFLNICSAWAKEIGLCCSVKKMRGIETIRHTIN